MDNEHHAVPQKSCWCACCHGLFHASSPSGPAATTPSQVHLRFQHDTSTPQQQALFPGAVLRLARSNPLSDLELHLTRGRWHARKWGAPLVPAKPQGAELEVGWLPGLQPDSVASDWSRVTHTLAGLLCTSLSLLGSTTGAVVLHSAHAQQGLQLLGPQLQPGLNSSTAERGSWGSSR